jgi:membrane-associated HD superfamily phosphohydrolase
MNKDPNIKELDWRERFSKLWPSISIGYDGSEADAMKRDEVKEFISKEIKTAYTLGFNDKERIAVEYLKQKLSQVEEKAYQRGLGDGMMKEAEHTENYIQEAREQTARDIQGIIKEKYMTDEWRIAELEAYCISNNINIHE